MGLHRNYTLAAFLEPLTVYPGSTSGLDLDNSIYSEFPSFVCAVLLPAVLNTTGGIVSLVHFHAAHIATEDTANTQSSVALLLGLVA
jgi:hypothetical protein